MTNGTGTSATLSASKAVPIPQETISRYFLVSQHSHKNDSQHSHYRNDSQGNSHQDRIFIHLDIYIDRLFPSLLGREPEPSIHLLDNNPEAMVISDQVKERCYVSNATGRCLVKQRFSLVLAPCDTCG